MSVLTTNTQNVSAGNGVATAFPFTFRFLSANQVRVWRTVAGASPALVPPAGYLLSPNPSGVGGSVTIYGPPPASGEQITVERVVEYTQRLAVNNQDGFYPQVVTDSLDALAMSDQQLALGIAQSIRAPAPEASIGSLPAAPLRANRVLGFDSAGAVIAVDPASASITTVIAADGTTPRLLADRFAEWVNVRDYGAVGNGLVDDTAAIQAAVTRAVQTGKGLRIPRGTFRLTAQITGGALVAIAGDGKAASVLIWDDLPSCGISLVYAAYGQALHVSGVTFRQKGTNRGTALLADFSAASLTWPGIWPRLLVEGCSFEGPDIPAQLTGWTIGIDTVAAAFGHIVNCDFNGVAGAPHTGLARGAVGVRFRGTAGGLYHNGHPVYCTVSRCNINNWQIGVHFSGCEGVVARDNSIVEVERGIVTTGDTTSGAGARPFVL
ncbi:hypothetical protein M0638_26970, partial [Roseomonas sp. NAR14]